MPKNPVDIVDQQLSRYREMRDFSITAEPAGKPKKAAKSAGLPFVIQKHAASHLHYGTTCSRAGLWPRARATS
jgi:DNA polymerase III delta subunit